MSYFYSGKDAVFYPAYLRPKLPSLHGCEYQLYIVYYNDCANDSNGSIEIEIVDYTTLIELYHDVHGNYNAFFDLMPSYFQGKWYYADNGYDSDYNDIKEIFDSADFIVGRDGSVEDEFNFIMHWAFTTKQNEANAKKCEHHFHKISQHGLWKDRQSTVY